MIYDSEPETLKHIETVRYYLSQMISDLAVRRFRHDESKLDEPEKSGFDEWTPKLKEFTYGSDEYRYALAGMKPFLDHHYEKNDHHPEHFEDGIEGMNLLQLCEMLVDWKAATSRHADGNLSKSLELNTKRFGLSPQLAKILRNTVDYLEW